MDGLLVFIVLSGVVTAIVIALKAAYDARAAEDQVFELSHKLRQLQLRLTADDDTRKIQGAAEARAAENAAPPNEEAAPAAESFDPRAAPEPSPPIQLEQQPQTAKQPNSAAEPIPLTVEPPHPAPTARQNRHKSEFDSFEAAVGKRWITWIGAIVLFLGVAFFLKYAIDQNWIKPAVRVGVGLIFGLVLVIVGQVSLRLDWRAFGQGLTGVGLAILYASLYTATHVYELIPHTAAFGGMVIVTAGGMGLAVKADARPLAFLAVLGGMLTPVLVSTGSNQRDALFAYLLLLDLGVFGVALFKEWKSLDYLTFIGTWLMVIGWYLAHYGRSQLTPTLVWIMAFNLMFLILPLVFHLSRRREASIGRFIIVIMNTAIALLFYHTLLMPEYRTTMAHLTLGLAALFFGIGLLARRRIRESRQTAPAFMGLFIIMLTLSLSIYFKARGQALAWTAEAPMLLLLGYVLRCRITRAFSFAALVLSVIAMLYECLPLHDALFQPVLNEDFLTALSMAGAPALFAIIHHLNRRRLTATGRWQRKITGLGAGFLGLFLLIAEVHEYYHYANQPHTGAFVAMLLCIAGAVAFAVAGVGLRSIAARLASGVPLGASVLYGFYLYSLDVNHPLILNRRFGLWLLAFAACVGIGLLFRRTRRTTPTDREFGNSLYVLAGIVLFILLSAEFYTWSRSGLTSAGNPLWMAQMSLTIVWGVYAIGLLIFGFLRDLRPVRIAALGVFGLAAIKLLLIDMASVQQLYRILSFIIVGLLMIAASFLYHKAEKRLQSAADAET